MRISTRLIWLDHLVLEPLSSIHSDCSPWAGQIPQRRFSQSPAQKGLTANVLRLGRLTHPRLIKTVPVLKLQVSILGTPTVPGKLRR